MNTIRRHLRHPAGVGSPSWPNRHAGLVLAVIGLALFVPSVIATNHLAAHQKWLADHGARTTALITAVTCNRGRCGDHARITFDTPDGRVTTTITLIEQATVGPGSHIPIAYDPVMPADARSMESNFSLPMREMLPALGFMLGVGLWIVAATRAGIRFVRRRRQRTMTHAGA